MEIASACLSVPIPALLERLRVVFWCEAEPAESKDGCAHRDVRRAVGHGSLTVGAHHGGCGGLHVARLANVLQHAVETITEGDQHVPDIPARHSVRNASTISGNHVRCRSPAGIQGPPSAWAMTSELIGDQRPLAVG